MFGSGLGGLAVMNGSRHSGWRHRENSFLLQCAPEISGQHDRYSSPRNLCKSFFSNTAAPNLNLAPFS
jgi:hypothetical protein